MWSEGGEDADPVVRSDWISREVVGVVLVDRVRRVELRTDRDRRLLLAGAGDRLA